MTAPPFDLIVFDYDGVIADSEVQNNIAIAEMLSDNGLPTTLDEALATYMGRRWRDCEPMIAAKLGRDLPADMLADWTARCERAARDGLAPVAGAQGFIVARSETICVASSSNPEWLRLGLERFGLSDAFGDRIFSAALHVSRGKPFPDLFLYAAETLGVRPSRALVIEDSVPGVEAGVAAGMTVVGLCAGGHIRDGHAERLVAAGAHHIFHDYAALDRWLDA